MFFQEPNPPQRKLGPLIGEPVKQGVRGSSAWFIKAFRFEGHTECLENGKGLFQLFSKGLLFRVFKSNQRVSIAIPYEQIKKLELIIGEEHISPSFGSPMWFLLKLKVPVRIARYFRGSRREYRVDPIILLIDSNVIDLAMETSGYAYHGQKFFFDKVRKFSLDSKTSSVI